MVKRKAFIEKGKNVYIVLVLSFVFSVVLRTGLGLLCGQMNVFYDELLHWNLSKSVYYGLGSNFRNEILSYKEILYSIVISISHAFGDIKTQYHVALGINSLLMSSVIFPVYFMSNRFLKNRQYSLIIAIISILIPEMYYTTKILQENLYYPMVIWFFYLFIFLILDDPYRIRNVVLLAVLLFFASLCKQMGLNLFTGVLLYYFLQFLIFDKDNRKECLISMLFFVTVFASLKFTYDTLFDIVNHISGESSSEVTIVVIIRNLLDGYLLPRLIFPVLSYCLLSILYFGYFTVILPLSIADKLDSKERNLLLITGSVLISTILVIALRIVPDENLDEIQIRFHFRYMFFLMVPLLMVFFRIYDKIKTYGFPYKIIILSVVYIFLLRLISIQPAEGSTIDCVGANYIKYLFNSDMMVNTLYMLIILGIAGAVYLLYKKKVKVFYTCMVTALLLMGIISNIYTYIYIHNDKQNSVNKNEDAIALNHYFKEQPDFDWKSLLIVSEKNASDAKLECFLDRPDYYYTKTEDFMDYINQYPQDSFWNMNLYSFNHMFHDQDIGYPKYIITNKEIYINGYRRVNLNLRRYCLYVRYEGNAE